MVLMSIHMNTHATFLTSIIPFAIAVKVLTLILSAFGLAQMRMAVFSDVGVMVIAVINAIRALGVKDL